MASPTLSDSPVSYSILKMDPPTLDWQVGNGVKADIDFRVTAADWFDFCQFLAGTPQTVGGQTRILPCTHPWSDKLVCTGIKSKGVGGWTAGNDEWMRQWSDARVKATFSTVPWTTDGSVQTAVVSSRGGSESYTLAGVKMSFADGTPIQADAARHVPTQVYQVTIYGCSSPGDDVYLPLYGKINNASLTLGSFVCPTGTVRFDSGGFEYSALSNFTVSYVRTLQLTYRPIHWNYALKADDTWALVTDPSSGTIYTEDDLSALFA